MKKTQPFVQQKSAANVFGSPSKPQTKSPTKASPTKRKPLAVSPGPEVVVNPDQLSALEMADHLLVMANRNRKMMLGYEKELLPHTLRRMIKNSDSTLEDAQHRLRAVLSSVEPAADREPFVSVGDAADRLADFESTADRLREIAQRLDKDLSVEIVE